MTGERVLLIDVDSTIPNLALMKLSAHHKAAGDIVGLNVDDPTLVYASVIFRANKHLTDGLKFYYPEAIINIGGSGHDLKAELPPEIEALKPDYSLYDMDYSLGFSSRGCIRQCHFCIVPEKEGRFRTTQHPAIWHDPKHNKIIFMDNNILANPAWFLEIADWIKSHDLRADFNQGLDARLITDEIAAALAQLRPINVWKFAFDNIGLEGQITSAIEILKRNRVDIRHKTLWYVYTHNDAEYSSAVKRCSILKAAGATPFIMYNREAERSQRIRDLQRWVNRPWIFWACDLADYNKQEITKAEALA